jgi:spore germination cell wall hydrolase CwlJ-like protein
MSRILQLASVVSLALMALTALLVTDASVAAAESAALTPSLSPRSDDLTRLPEADTLTRTTPAIIFAPPQPVVQLLSPEAVKADSLANAAATVAPLRQDGGANSLAELVAMQDVGGALERELHCLAGAVYFEAKGESLYGQLAVARVVIARKDSPRFPNSICGVVYQKSQFSFVRGGRMPRIQTGSAHWRNAVAIAKIAQANGWVSKAEGALFFHARYVNPGWRLDRMTAIDNHIFYR